MPDSLSGGLIKSGMTPMIVCKPRAFVTAAYHLGPAIGGIIDSCPCMARQSGFSPLSSMLYLPTLFLALLLQHRTLDAACRFNTPHSPLSSL